MKEKMARVGAGAMMRWRLDGFVDIDEKKEKKFGWNRRQRQRFFFA